MYRFLIILILTGVAGSVNAQCVFNKLYGNDSTAVDFGNGLLETLDGGILAYGHSTLNGSSRNFLVKTTSCGDTLWTSVRNWSAQGGEVYYEAEEMANGDIFFSGAIYDPNEGGADSYVYRTNSTGDSLMYREYDFGYNDWGTGLEVIGDSMYLILATQFNATHMMLCLMNGDTLWQDSISVLDTGYQVNEVIEWNGDLYMGGEATYQNGDRDYFLTRYGLDGTRKWFTVYGDNDDQLWGRITMLSTGHILQLGQQFDGANYDALLCKSDTSGDLIWSKTYGTANEAQTFRHAVESSWQTIVASGIEMDVTTTPNRPRLRFMELTMDGDSINGSIHTHYGGNTHDYNEDMIQTSDGGFMVTGYVINNALPANNELLLLKVDSNLYGCTVDTTVQDWCIEVDCNYITADFSVSDTVVMVNDTAWITTHYDGLGTVMVWGFDNQYWTTDNSYSFPYTSEGVYSIQCVVQGPTGFCMDTVYQDVVVVEGVTGDDEMVMDDVVKVWPNPSDGRFLVESRQVGTIRVYNIAGQEIQATQHLGGRTHVRLPEVAGVYFLRLGSVNRKIVVR